MTNTVPPKVDVLVVGGGPAGSAAAISLARAGRAVTVVDKATFPRDKCCGDGLTTLALRELEHLGVPTDDITSFTEIGGARLRSPAGREFTVPLPTTGTYAAVARRLDLDATLLASAEREGAQVLQGVSVSGASRAGDVVTVDLDGLGPVTPSFVVAADGMWSTVRRELGLTPEGYR
ncbi:MAG: NAD(P)/FAD-dependent oxidoreductase, partial [Ilumatobacteraceae bacterium]